MDPEKPLKHPISRILSFISCKSCHVSDVAGRPVSTPQHFRLKELFSTKPHRPTFSICGPKQSETVEMCMRPRGADGLPLLCPPVSPVTALETWHKFEGEGPEVKGGEKKSSEMNSKGALVDKKGTKREKKRDKTTLWPTNISNSNYYDWSTSDDDDVDTDDDDDKTTLFSSKSISSDSPHSFRRSRSHHSRRSTPTGGDRTAVRDGLAVVKRSSDPYSDFRNSMVEMIVEKQIFGARELEELLQTFLSLNTCHHHRVIVEVFTEIWEALFSE